ncbi:phage tail protein, partial [Bowmanella yangjiangensis]
MSRPGLSYESILAGWAVSSVVADICDRAGIPYDRLNVDLVEGYVDGFSTTSAQTAAGAIDALSGVYLFDAANFGGVLNFIPRGGDHVAEIELED